MFRYIYSGCKKRHHFYLKRNFKMNLTHEEEMAMKKLLNDSSIVIRPADKGLGIVIMNTEDYTNKLEKEMKDNGTYAQLQNT